MDFFLEDSDEQVTLPEDEKKRIETVLEKLVGESSEQGISLVALKNARITRPMLFQLAKEHNEHASHVLTELNQRGILEEAKNPDTKEEVAIEMLGRLVGSQIPSIRRRAIHILLKVHPDKLVEILNDRTLTPIVRSEIFNDILSDEETSLRIMLRLLRHPSTPTEIRERIVSKIARIRKIVEENSGQIIEWNHRIEDLEKRKRIKFHTIEKFHKEVLESLDEFKTIPNFVMDLKFDVELAFENLKATIKGSS